MSFLNKIYHTDGNRVPQWPFTLNRSSPLARGLIAWFPTPLYGVAGAVAASGQTVHDLSGFKQHADNTTEGSGQGVSSERGEFGSVVWRNTALSNEIVLPDLSSKFNGYASLVIWLKNDSGQTESPFGLSSSISRNHYPFSDGNLYLGMFRTDRLSLGDNSAFDKTVAHCLVCTTANGGNWSLYQNGELFNTAAAQSAITWPTGASLGKSLNAGGAQYGGQFWGVAFYNRELTATEAFAHWAPQTRWDLYAPIPTRRYMSLPAAAVGGRIMSSLVSSGGLVGKGGIAGQGGGLAA